MKKLKSLLGLSILLIVVALLAGGSSFYFLYMNGLQADGERLDQVSKDLDAARQKQRDLPALRNQLVDATMRAHQIRLQIPDFDKFEFDNFIRHLKQVASQTGVIIREPRSVPPKQKGPGAQEAALPAEMEVALYEFKATGDFMRLWEFLGTMENSIRYVRIDNLNFSKGREQGGEGKDQEVTSLTLTISAFAYKMPAGTSLAAPSAPSQTTPPSPMTTPPPY